MYEVKRDGYRLAVHIEPGQVRIITRGGYDWTSRFLAIFDARRLRREDGHPRRRGPPCSMDGRSDLGMLQRPLWRLPSPYETGSVVFYAFDLLYLDGRDLRRLPQRERRLLLQPVLAGREGAIRLSEEVQADGEEFLRAARLASHIETGVIDAASKQHHPRRQGLKCTKVAGLGGVARQVPPSPHDCGRRS
ncbi:hypothetical protein [Ensifer aridi]|uniref:ATP-dependent DNA ligase n=1 Tax=Ensifer aridi TaxID=1708715 RepID=UPI003B84A436